MCNESEKNPSHYSLQQHRRKYHRFKARKTSDSVAYLNKILEIEEDSDQLRNELNACQHFLTVTEIKNERYKVFKFHLSKLDTVRFLSYFESSMQLGLVSVPQYSDE